MILLRSLLIVVNLLIVAHINNLAAMFGDIYRGEQLSAT
jgi:hypothetical protein